MLRVKSTYKERTNKRLGKNSFNWDLIEISFFGRFIIKKRFRVRSAYDDVSNSGELSCKAFQGLSPFVSNNFLFNKKTRKQT